MTVATEALIGILFGIALGSTFFGTLWWTVHGLLESERPTRRMVLSFVLRMGLLAAGLVLMARLGIVAILCALLGILAARTIFIRYMGLDGRVVEAPSSTRGEPGCR